MKKGESEKRREESHLRGRTGATSAGLGARGVLLFNTITVTMVLASANVARGSQFIREQGREGAAGIAGRPKAVVLWENPICKSLLFTVLIYCIGQSSAG